MKTKFKEIAKKYGWIAGGVMLIIVASIGLAGMLRSGGKSGGGLNIVDDDAPLADDMQFSAYFYISEEPINGEIHVDRLLKVGDGVIKVTATGKRDFSAEGVEVITAPDTSAYVDGDHKVVWTHMYGIGDVRTVVGQIFELTEEEKANKIYVVPNVEEMQNLNPRVNQRIQTEGYYKKNDGGGANYLVTERAESDLTSVLLSNGLYATLQTDGMLNIRQIGAYGDGSHDDFEFLDKALRSNFDTIYIPEGTYAMNGKTASLKAWKNIVGAGKDSTILNNMGIKAQYGLRLEGIFFKGGADQRVAYTGSGAETLNVIINATPKGVQSVEYVNCGFSDTVMASYARELVGSFSSDIITGCTFNNIERVAVYHSLVSGKSVFNGNTVTNIGSRNFTTGFVAAIWIGDVTNITCVESADIEIKDNKMSNLMTGDDIEYTVHAINANFISIRGDRAVIDNNEINGLVGFGDDREAIYTKVRDLTITRNTVTNGGLGEGYVCNKSHDGDAYVNISDNKFIGDAGTGIRNYCAGTIYNNTIEIKNCVSAITVTRRSGLTNMLPLTISENTIKCGTSDVLQVDGHRIESYGSGKGIRLSNVSSDIIINDNKFYPTTPFGMYFSVSNPGGNVSVTGNRIEAPNFDGIGILVGCTSKFVPRSADSIIDVSHNKIFLLSGERAVSINFKPSAAEGSNREIVYQNNEITFSGDKKSYALVCYSEESNQDNLVVAGNTSNIAGSNTRVVYSVNSLSHNEDEGFAVFNSK